jgi:mono/diheme cytochrome c family protein
MGTMSAGVLSSMARWFPRTARSAFAGLARCLAAVGCLCAGHGASASEQPHPGRSIYTDLCARCHGEQGEGVAGNYEEPLTGSRSLESLTRLIERTMPEDDPSLCVGEDAKLVADYVYNQFYSPAAQARRASARVELARLTI